MTGIVVGADVSARRISVSTSGCGRGVPSFG
jgi:hypothetical protein